MSLTNLQIKIGATPDGVFGPNTMKKAMEYFNLNPIEATHFFGQIAHETGNFTIFTENLNYSAKGLKATFGKYFYGNLAELYERQPEKIANRVYAGRMGNGDEKSGDGWKYRGRGAIQLTGSSNYKQLSKILKKPEIWTTDPDLVATEYAFESAKMYFDNNNLWNICNLGVNEDSILRLSKAINLGNQWSKVTPNGLEDRIEKTHKFYNYVK